MEHREQDQESTLPQAQDAASAPVHVHGPGCRHHHHHAQEPFVRQAPKVGPNDPCICGSGKKFKKCCRPL